MMRLPFIALQIVLVGAVVAVGISLSFVRAPRRIVRAPDPMDGVHHAR